jgi:hypothetical protein
MPEGPKSITLSYEPRRNGVGIREHARRWFRYPGPDSFLGSAALFFAVLACALAVVGWVVTDSRADWGAALLIGLLFDPLAGLTGVAALFERQSSKLFPSVALLLTGAHLFLVLVLLPSF